MRTTLVLTLALSLVFGSCEGGLFGKKESGASTPAPVGPPAVTSMLLQYREMKEPAILPAVVGAERSIRLYALEGGIVRTVYKNLGDYVVEGEVVAELDQPVLVQELRQADLRLQQLKSQKAGATATIARAEAGEKYYKKLYDRLSRTPGQATNLQADDIAKAEMNWKQSEADRLLAVAQNTMLDAEIAAAEELVNTLRLRVEGLVVKAPFSGYLSKRMANPGNLFYPALRDTHSFPVAEMVDPASLEIWLRFPTSLAGCLEMGTPLEIKAGAQTKTSSIERIGWVVDTAQQTIQAVARLDNTDKSLRPGQSVEVRTTQSCAWNVLAVPKEAVFQNYSAPYIWIVEESQARQVPVTLGVESEGWVEIAGSKIREGMIVVTRSPVVLSEGLAVQVVE